MEENMEASKVMKTPYLQKTNPISKSN